MVISLGAEGALWVNASGAWIAKPPSCEVVSTVGAGDSMVGGLIYGLLMRESSEHTLRLATAVGAGGQPEQRRRDRSSPVGRDDGARRSETFQSIAGGRMKTLLMVDSSLGQARGHLAKRMLEAAAAKPA